MNVDSQMIGEVGLEVPVAVAVAVTVELLILHPVIVVHARVEHPTV